MNIKSVNRKSICSTIQRNSVCLVFVKSFDTLPKQKLHKLLLSFALNLQISVLFTYNKLP